MSRIRRTVAGLALILSIAGTAAAADGAAVTGRSTPLRSVALADRSSVVTDGGSEWG